MNTFKTTACLLSLVTAGFAMEDTPPHTPLRHGGVQQNLTDVVTPVIAMGAMNLGTPSHHLVPQQLFANTPQNGAQQNMFVTPQGQAVENQAPNAPGRIRRAVVGTPGSELDYLASTINSAASPEIRKRSNFGDVTILDSKGRSILTTAKRKKGKSSSLVQECGSPTGIEEALSFFDRLETSGRTPFAPQFATSASTPSVHPSVLQFTTGKSMAFIGSVDPVLEDDSYISEDEIIEEERVEEGDMSIVSAQNTSVGSFVLHGANLLGANSDLNDDSFVLHGAHLLNSTSVVSEEEDALSEIGDDNSVDGYFSDIDARYTNDYFSDEE